MTVHRMPRHVFVLAGQSNMAGRGGVHSMPGGGKAWDQELPSELTSPGIEVSCWDASGQWHQAEEPLHADIDLGSELGLGGLLNISICTGTLAYRKVCGVGPGIVFAKTLHKFNRLDTSEGGIGLVPCAIGASCIDEWLPGTQNFNQMVKRAKDAIAALPCGAKVQGLLWYQGESDSDSLEKVQGYSKKVCMVFDAFRPEVQEKAIIVQVAITCTNTKKAPYWAAINKIQLTEIHPCIRNLATVDARGLALQVDGIHLTTEAQIWLGQALAEEFDRVYVENRI